MKKTLAQVKNFWDDHKIAIMTTTLVAAATVVQVQKSALKDHNEFLKKEGLYDKYYELNEWDIPTE